MKKIILLLFAIPMLFAATGYLVIDNDGLSKIILKSIVNYEKLKTETPHTFEVMDSWVVDQGVRSKYAILKSAAGKEILERVTGLSVFTSGPHSDGIEYKAQTMGYYNPEFIEFAHTTIEQLFEDPEFTEAAGALYTHRFQNMLRAYYVAHKRMYDEIGEQKLAGIRAEYLDYTRKGNVPDYYVETKFWDTSKKMTSLGYELYESNVAMGFWLRRSIDNTDKQFLKLLELVFKHLDPGFVSLNLLGGQWTDGEAAYGLESYSDNLAIYSGGSLHEGGFGFGILVNDDNTMQAVSANNGYSSFAREDYKVELFQFQDHTAFVLRDSDNQLKHWLRKMNPSEHLYTHFLLNKTKHQLSGKYLRADNHANVVFYPDRFEVTGLSSEESYQYAVDEIDFPMDIIYMSNGLALAYKKTGSGLDLYSASKNEGEWLASDLLVASLVKTAALLPGGSSKHPGKYPFASVDILTMDILNYYSKTELRIMRNEIFARHGYKFKSAGMQNYFGNEEWYNGRYENVTDKLTPLEMLNIEIIQYFEKMK